MISKYKEFVEKNIKNGKLKKATIGYKEWKEQR